MEKPKGRPNEANIRANPAEAAQRSESNHTGLEINRRSLTDDHRTDIFGNKSALAAVLPRQAEELRLDCTGSHVKLETRLDQVFKELKEFEKIDGGLTKRVEKAESSTVELKKSTEEVLKASEELRKGTVELKDRKSTRLNSSHVLRSRMPSSA